MLRTSYSFRNRAYSADTAKFDVDVVAATTSAFSNGEEEEEDYFEEALDWEERNVHPNPQPIATPRPRRPKVDLSNLSIKLIMARFIKNEKELLK